MKWKGKKLFNVIILLMLLDPTSTIAHFGGKDKDGGHICRKSCEEYNLEYGQYHIHEPNTFRTISEPEQKTSNPEGVKMSTQDSEGSFFTWSYFIWAGILSLLLSWFCATCCLVNRCVNRFSNWFTSMLFKSRKAPNKK